MLASSRRWVLGALTLILLCLGLPPACSIPDYRFDDSDGGVPLESIRKDCRRDSDCEDQALTQTCDVRAGFCVECLPELEATANQCGMGLFCQTDTRCVVGCSDDSDCNPGLSCDPESHRCNGCQGNFDCTAGSACEDGVCVPSCEADETCPLGFSCCSGVCANPLGDPLHCSMCGGACADGEECVNGQCGSSGCRVGVADCDGNRKNGCEVNLASDRRHCGSCATDCGRDFCNGGRCSPLDCADGLADCDGQIDTECEADLGSVESCGFCNERCASIHGTATCTERRCSVVCDGGFDDCDGNSETGCETETLSDPLHCGQCSIACANENGTTRCADGACTPVCSTGAADCDGDPNDGCETLTDDSLESCGGCGRTCALEHATEQCVLGVCSIVGCEDASGNCGGCEPGFADCDGDAKNGCEADLSSPDSCGTCGNVCSDNGGTAICGADGECSIECSSGRADCVNGLADGCETNRLSNIRHCDDCATVCTAPSGSTPVCIDGKCDISNCPSGRADCEDETAPDDTSCETNTNSDPLNCGGCTNACFYRNGSGRCVNGECEFDSCNDGFADCDDDVSTGCETELGNTANCGGCGDTCTNENGNTQCESGSCVPECNTSWGDCDNSRQNGCETPLNTNDDCAACGESCSRRNAVTSCANRQCVVSSCTRGFDNCNPNEEPLVQDGCETNVFTTANCGACGIPCSFPNASASCALGTCTPGGCNTGFDDCSDTAPGCETRLGTNQNCDRCGGACQTLNVNVTSNVCTGTPPASACVAMCTAGFKSCDNDEHNGCERDITTPTNCGDCNRSCSLPNTATYLCASAVCQVQTCTLGFANCDAPSNTNGCERPVSSDIQNCGACGNICSSTNGTPGCSNRACTISCATGFGNCDNNIGNGCEHDTTDDPANCGTCGTTCGATSPFCVARVCRPRLDIGVVSNVSASQTTTGTNLLLAHSLQNPVGNRRAVVVGIVGRGNNADSRPSAVSYNGTAMVLAAASDAGGPVYTAIYYLTDAVLPAAAGTYNLVVTASSTQNTFGFLANVLELRGVERGTGAIEASANQSVTTCSAANLQVNVATPGAVIYGVLGIDGSPGAATLAGSGQTVTLQTSVAATGGSLGVAAGRSAPVTTTGLTAFNWLRPQSCNAWKNVAVSIRPAVTP